MDSKSRRDTSSSRKGSDVRTGVVDKRSFAVVVRGGNKVDERNKKSTTKDCMTHENGNNKDERQQEDGRIIEVDDEEKNDEVISRSVVGESNLTVFSPSYLFYVRSKGCARWM